LGGGTGVFSEEVSENFDAAKVTKPPTAPASNVDQILCIAKKLNNVG
jgi:hypothetical protein